MAQKSYEADGIVVRFDPRRCIHAAECVHGLPSVFDAERRPWIKPDQGSPEDVAEVVRRCPTGALTYQRTDGGPQESPSDPPSIVATTDGPLYVRGRGSVLRPDGTPLQTGPRAALCRCGASKNKPFCDNSHLAIGFSSSV